MTSSQQKTRPHDIYRREFLARILDGKPSSLLDVGCGDGTLLKAVAGAGNIRVSGLEPGPESGKVQAQGLEIHSGRAEALPFGDKSFDVVTFQYVTHHLEDMGKSLSEAVRVAKRAVLILDGWYDDTIASQRVAREFDEWAKAIDRETGMIHNPCPAPRELVDLLAAAGFAHSDYACRLALSPLALADVEDYARSHMKAAKAGPEAAARLDHILRQAGIHGISDDGAVFVRAMPAAG